jgi:3-oxoacyl-[acyl-carrier protein] reductase
MELGLAEKVVLISGSSRGIGSRVAHAFAAEGARVVINGRTPAAVSKAADEVAARYGADRVLSVVGDSTSAEGARLLVERTRDRWGVIDVLVANVGGTGSPGWDLDDAEWSRVFEQNFFGSIRLVRAAVPHITASGQGAVCLVCSIAGLEDLGAPVTYASAKAALISSAHALARQLAPRRIRVNAVAPGNVLFPGGAWEHRLAERGETVRQMIEREVPLQRFGSPEEIADVLLFLCSPRASFVTGACWVVDGGQTRRFC